MTPHSKLFSFIALLLTVSPDLFSQVKATGSSKDSVITVAIYSSDKSFFTDYPIDSVVSNLNSLNTNRKIKYCKKTEDNSRTGLQADYIVNLNVGTSKGAYVAPTYGTASQPVYYPSQDTGKGSIPIIRNEPGYVQTSAAHYKPDQFTLDVTINSKIRNQRKRHTKITGDNGASSLWFNRNLEFSNQIALILEMETYLLARFSK